MTEVTEETKEKYTGSDTEGGITSSYEMDDGVTLKVPYSFFGSIYDEDEKKRGAGSDGAGHAHHGPAGRCIPEGVRGRKSASSTRSPSPTAPPPCTSPPSYSISKPGDEVIVTPNTFIATSLVVLKEGGVPVYADIDPRTFNIDPAEIAKKITPKTKAIYVVHYGGQMCDMDPIMEIARKHNLFVLEDCAHTPGATYKGRKAGTIGDVGCF